MKPDPREALTVTEIVSTSVRVLYPTDSSEGVMPESEAVSIDWHLDPEKVVEALTKSAAEIRDHHQLTKESPATARVNTNRRKGGRLFT